jgi:hypothetical protein
MLSGFGSLPLRKEFLRLMQRAVSPFIGSLLDDTSDVGARTTLGAAGSGAVGSSGLTMITARILGRIAGGTGAVQELTTAEVINLLGIADQLAQPGDMKPVTRTTAPSGWLAMPLVPTNISRTTYASLFAAIGTQWGAGDGSTTFGCPYCPADHVPVQANANVGTATVGQVISHTHSRDTYNTDSGGSGEIRAGGGADAGDWVSNPTGGAANLAAGVRVLWCVKL